MGVISFSVVACCVALRPSLRGPSAGRAEAGETRHGSWSIPEGTGV